MIDEKDQQITMESMLGQRKLTTGEIQKHFDCFGLEPAFAQHTRMGALSGGQKVKVVLGAGLWNLPHLIILDEPTNFLDRDSLGALALAIKEFKGGIFMISHNAEFYEALCPEKWILESGRLTVMGAEWMEEVETVTAQSWSLLGSAYYQIGNFKKSMSSMETAILMAEEEGYKPKENWYNIMAACIGELKLEIGEKKALLQQLDIYEILVNLYPKKLYFIQLAGTYGQLGREKDYMITLKAAHAKDFLDRESEYLALAQLLLVNQNPYWAAKVLVSGQEKIVTTVETVVDEVTKEESKIEKIGPVVKDTEKNLKLLADSWRMAQEIDLAIPVLAQAAELSKDGKAYVLLGNLYLAEDKLDEAVDAIKKGLKKGKIQKISQVHLTLGQAYFELLKFEDAKKQFRTAARDKDKKIKTQANNWIKYTENEEIRVKNLALRRDYIQSQS